MNEKIEFLPFNAINEFMLSEYRKVVFKSVFSNFASLQNSRQKSINSLIKKNVKIQGFRDSTQAPVVYKINNSISLFEKSASFSAEILSAWYELNPDLAQKVNQMLTDKGWIILPIETDRSKLPGFLIKWPAEDSFEKLTEEFRNIYPEITYSDDDISLMIVWMSNRLPYEMDAENIFSKE
ncbi:MAG: hypothetical protein CVU46_15420 [Chloroflexi bacterium HGW-Chloroflexi-8]|nr:MAG: hypothetical protein CVU46_15420 [Chloroflexi bacterium HGW-Chloroflexi-8]